MDHLLPPAFIAIAALCLCVALYALWQSLRGLFEERTGQKRVAARSDRQALLEQKTTLLRALRDLRSERDVGKISDQDFEALDARYRAQAKKVLRQLDAQLGGFRKEAKALLDAQAPETVHGAARAETADPEPASTAAASAGEDR